MTQPKVALVYDRVNTPHGGAEKVLLALHEIYPDAPLYTSLYDPQNAPWANVFTVHSSWLSNIPILRKKHQFLAFLMPLIFESFDFSDYDLVISVTSAEAKGIITKPDTFHLCYLLTPSRYLYSHQQDYFRSSWLNWPIINWITRKILNYLTTWDQMAIHRPDLIVPISNLVKNRAKQYYGVTTTEPIYPSVISPNEVLSNKKQTTNNSTNAEPYFLIVSRLVPYKKIDLAIKACQSLGKKLVIVGDGTHKKTLQYLTKKTANNMGGKIYFTGNVTKSKLITLYQNCQAVLMPGEEDFGIVALEALSHLKPVIINAKSGASELIARGKTGILLEKADLTDLKFALLEVEKHHFDPAIMKRCVGQFNQAVFIKKISQTAKTALEQKDYAR